MAPPYRHYRDPDQRAADQAAGCGLALLLIIIFFPLYWLYKASRIERPYTPWSPEMPISKAKPRTYADYTMGDWLVFAGVMAGLFLGAIPLIGTNPSAAYTLMGVVLALAAGWEWYRRHSLATAAKQQIEQRLLEYPQSLLKSRIYTIYPAHDKPDLVAGEKLVTALLSAMPRLTFQIVAEPGRLCWQVVDTGGQYQEQAVADTLKSYLGPEAQIEVSKGSQDGTDGRLPYFRDHLYFGLANEYVAPLPFLTLLKSYDPLTTLTQRMELLQPQFKERVIYQIAVTTVSDQARTIGAKRYEQGNVNALPGVPRDRDKEETGLDERLIEAKLSLPLYHCFVGITIESQDKERLNNLRHFADDVSQFAIPGHNRLELRAGVSISAVLPDGLLQSTGDDYATRFGAILLYAAHQSDHWRYLLSVLSPAEIAALWHLPNDTFTAKSIAWAGRPVPAQLTDATTEQVVIGTSVSPGQRQAIYLANQDRAHHLYITGKTGMGKSTLIHNLVQQDMAAGRGVVVIDPHGKLVDDILASSIPKNRVADVVLLECGNSDYPVPLNPLRIPQGTSFDTAFNYLYWVLKKLYASVWRERMDLVYRNVLQALLTDPEATPLDIERLFTNVQYREFIISRIEQHPAGTTALETFWREFGGRTRSEQAEFAAPILNRTAIFLGNRTLEQMMCHPHTLNFQSFIQTKKIVLINLSGEAIRSEVGNLGALFLASFYLGSEALGYLPDNAPPRCYLYVDEVERIITSPLPEMFSHERKFGLSLTLANQYLDQLSEETLNGILGNVGTKLIFECGERDARTLAIHFEPEFDRSDLLNLGAYQMLVKTRFQGRTLPAFVVATRPAPPRKRAAPIATIRQQSYAQQGFLPTAEVRTWLKDRYAPPAKTTTKKVKSKTDELSDYE